MAGSFAAVRLAAIVLMAAALLTGCARDGRVSGVYVATSPGGAPGWIGGPAGIPVWSPAANAVAWGSEDGLFLSELDGQPPTKLAAHAVAGRPAWSPDGATIAYVDRDLAALRVVEAATATVSFETPVRNIDAGSEPLGLSSLGGPSWSPDGSRIAFTCWDGAGDELCVIGADGGGRQQVTRITETLSRPALSAIPAAPAASNVGGAAWSPDGSIVAVAAYPERRGAPSGVFAVNLERGRARRLSPLLPNSEIHWLPDGQAVVFSASHEGRSDAVRVEIEDGAQTTLTASLAIGSRDPALSPDGTRLAVASGRGIVVLDLEGAELEVLDSGLRDRFPAWSADGDALSFAADPNPILNYD